MIQEDQKIKQYNDVTYGAKVYSRHTNTKHQL